MSGRHLIEVGLLNFAGVARFVNVIDIVNIPGTVKLRHKQGIPVPELRLYQRTIKLLEAEGSQLVLYPMKILTIRITPPQQHPVRRSLNIVLTKTLPLPGTGGEHLGAKLPYLLAGNPPLKKLIPSRRSGLA